MPMGMQERAFSRGQPWASQPPRTWGLPTADWGPHCVARVTWEVELGHSWRGSERNPQQTPARPRPGHGREDRVPGQRPTCRPPTGHAGGAPAELRAPGRDAVGDAAPVQPRPLPGRRWVLREAGGLPAFLCRYCALAGGRPGPQGPREPRLAGWQGPPATVSGSPPCTRVPRRPPRLCGGEPGKVRALPAVCGPPAEIPPAAPARAQPRHPGHHAHPGLHHAATSPGPARRAQAAGALTVGGPGLGWWRVMRGALGVMGTTWQAAPQPKPGSQPARAVYPRPGSHVWAPRGTGVPHPCPKTPPKPRPLPHRPPPHPAGPDPGA